MQLPSPDAHYSHRVSFGSYVIGRLRRAKFTALATDAELATQAVKTKGRAWEDANEPVQQALAQRDSADDGLDDTAQQLRNGMAGRGVSAVKEEPYTQIFPQGIVYYTAARLEDELARYTELQQRITQHLPASDPLQKPALDALAQGMGDFQNASTALTQARVQEAMAKTALDAAEDAWDRLMEKMYGELVIQVGRKAAERFFPKLRGKAKAKADDDAGGG